MFNDILKKLSIYSRAFTASVKAYMSAFGRSFYLSYKPGLLARTVRRLIVLIMVFSNLLPISPYASVWPSDVVVEADGAIVIDAESGTVLYEKNPHNRYFPASITKILTALIVIEKCNLDDSLTFSYNAVHNVEAGSSSAGFSVGDTVTVKDALYAMMLQSANEAANALAEHCAGSIEEFSKLMTEKAVAIGCTNSNFMNPSGLNNPDHYTSAYDFALISREAFLNPTLLEIASSVTYRLPPYKAEPEGFDIYNHHGMIRRSNPNFYPYAVGGKTGYTMLAGNTLVTYGSKDGMSLITVVLNGRKTHYTDTKALMEFGFNNFHKIDIDDIYSEKQSIDIRFIKDKEDMIPALSSPDNHTVILPKDADTSLISHRLNYKPGGIIKDNVLAHIEYLYQDRQVGYSPLYLDTIGTEDLADSNVSIVANPQGTRKKNVTKSSDASFFSKFAHFMIKNQFYFFVGFAIIVLIIIALIIIKLVVSYREVKELTFLREERKKRRIMYGWSQEQLNLSNHSRRKKGRYNIFDKKEE